MAQMQSIRKTLYLLVKQHGTGLCFLAVNCKMLLTDNCPANRNEIELLITAIEHEITSEMLRLKKTMPISTLLPKLTRWLTNRTTVSVADGQWAVESWAMALDILPFSEQLLPSLK